MNIDEQIVRLQKMIGNDYTVVFYGFNNDFNKPKGFYAEPEYCSYGDSEYLGYNYLEALLTIEKNYHDN